MLILNTARTFPAPVTVHFHDEAGKPQKGTFEATFRVVPASEILEATDKSALDLVLVSVNEEQLQLTDPKGQVLSGEALLAAAKADPAISNAMLATYGELVAKKNLKQP